MSIAIIQTSNVDSVFDGNRRLRLETLEINKSNTVVGFNGLGSTETPNTWLLAPGTYRFTAYISAGLGAGLSQTNFVFLMDETTQNIIEQSPTLAQTVSGPPAQPFTADATTLCFSAQYSFEVGVRLFSLKSAANTSMMPAQHHIATTLGGSVIPSSWLKLKILRTA